MRFAKSDDQLLENAMLKARELIMFHLEDTRLGLSLLDRAGRLVSDSEMRTSIRDSFVGKAVGTILKRVTDYHRFSRWVCMNGLCRPLAPTATLSTLGTACVFPQYYPIRTTKHPKL